MSALVILRIIIFLNDFPRARGVVLLRVPSATLNRYLRNSVFFVFRYYACFSYGDGCFFLCVRVFRLVFLLLYVFFSFVLGACTYFIFFRCLYNRGVVSVDRPLTREVEPHSLTSCIKRGRLMNRNTILHGVVSTKHVSSFVL